MEIGGGGLYWIGTSLKYFSDQPITVLFTPDTDLTIGVGSENVGKVKGRNWYKMAPKAR